jgi:hercynylcysteine S-oxide lyase
MFDTAVLFSGIKLPWEGLFKVCKDLGVLSLIDGAHELGHIDLGHLSQVDPGFFTSNCHK